MNDDPRDRFERKSGLLIKLCLTKIKLAKFDQTYGKRLANFHSSILLRIDLLPDLFSPLGQLSWPFGEDKLMVTILAFSTSQNHQTEIVYLAQRGQLGHRMHCARIAKIKQKLN